METGEGEKTEYRVWNPFRSKLAASVLAGLDNIYIKPGGKVLYLGAASGTSVSHVSDIVGPTGAVFAVEFSHRSGEFSVHCHSLCCVLRHQQCSACTLHAPKAGASVCAPRVGVKSSRCRLFALLLSPASFRV